MPTVSVIVPCYNEEMTITSLMQAVYDQTYPRGEIELIIADGMSTDQTRERINDFRFLHPDFSIISINNPEQHIPTALNHALEAASGKYIIRLDAHSIPAADYIERCVAWLDMEKADNVGGAWEIKASSASWMARSIALAAGHPFGVGDARYRFSRKAGFVDTIPFGAFHRALFQRLGVFNENLLTNEDYEFNARIRGSGGRIWFDPEIRSVYFARKDYVALAQQYWRYGYWKWRMLKLFPKTLRWRQALPPLFVCFTIIGCLLAPFWVTAREAVFSILCLYLIILGLSALPVAFQQNEIRYVIGVPIAILIMHCCWGAGFLWSMVKSFALH